MRFRNKFKKSLRHRATILKRRERIKRISNK